MSMLLKNAAILKSTDQGYEYIKDGFLGVEGSRIDYIGTVRPDKVYEEEKDMRGKLLIPGLVNAHTHSAMTLLRGLSSDMPLQDWLHSLWPIEDKMRVEDLKAGMELAIMEMLATGTTCFSDSYILPYFIAPTVLESGIKANISRVIQVFEPMDDSLYKDFYRRKEALELFRDFNGAGEGRLKVDFGIHAEYTNKENFVRFWAEDAKELGAHIQLHMSETRLEHEECLQKYGKTPCQWFNDLGTFENPTYAAHCVWVTEDDMDIMKEKGVTCVHNPSSNMKLASGFAPIPRMVEKGINVALGTDGCSSNNNLNMFEEMHLASIIHNGYTLDPLVMKAGTVLDMATRNGAKALGRPDCGVLREGYAADVVAIDLDKPHLIPNLDPVALLTYSAQGSDVYMTMVDGRILYEDGDYKTLDKERIFSSVRKSVDFLLS